MTYPNYREAQRAARAAAGSLSESAVAAIREELQREGTRLAARIAALPVGNPSSLRAALEASAKIVAQMEARLLAAGTQAIVQHRAVAFSEVAGIWQKAALATAQVQGVPNALLGAVRQPPITLLGSYEALGGASAHWKTALQGSIKAGGADLDAIVRHGLSNQVSPEDIARGLRAYVVGAEPFHDAFKGEAFVRVQDLRSGVPAALRESGRKMASNARRIAYSEVHNARAEAEVTHFAIDPMVAMVRWTLSPFRGEVVLPDVCDMLASADWYGLGAGLYPIGKVPPPPHPFDRCERMPVTRSAAHAGDAKPYPMRSLPIGKARIPTMFRATTTAAQEARIVAQAEQVMGATEAWAVKNPLQQLTTAGLPSGTALAQSVSLQQAVLARTQAAALAALPPAPVAGPVLHVPYLPPAPVKLGAFVVPGELAAQPGVLEQVQLLIKQHRNKSPYALGKLEAMGVDVTLPKAAQVVKAAKKAAAADAQLAVDIADEVGGLKAIGIHVDVSARSHTTGLLQQLTATKQAATAALTQSYDVAASAATMTAGAFPGADVAAFLERAFVHAGKSIDLTDVASVAQLLEQAPNARAGQKLVLAAKKAKASAASKLAAQTKAKAAAEQLATSTGVTFAEGTPLATINAAKTVLQELDVAVLKAAEHAKVGQIVALRTNAKAKLAKLGATAPSLDALEAGWKTLPLGPLTPAAPVAAIANTSGVLDPAVVLAKQVGPQAGTNAGGRFLGTDGVTRYVKFYATPAQAHSEALANTLYRDLGLRAPRSGVGVTADGKTFFASEVLDVTGTIGQTGLTPDVAREILDGFAADVLTANWDAVGTGLDNVVQLAAGGVARIDQGGSLLFRAQGGLKSAVKGYGAKGLKEIREFDTLFTENAYYRKVFTTAGLTPDTMGQQLVQAVNRMTLLEQQAGGFAAYVEQMAPGLLLAERKQVSDMLTARLAQLRVRANAAVATLADPGPVVLAVPKTPLNAVLPSPVANTAFEALPYQITEAQAAKVPIPIATAKPFYFQSGKTSLAKLETGIDLAAAPTEFGVQAFSVTASPGAAKHQSAIVSRFLVAPKTPLFVDATGLTAAADVREVLESVIEGAIGKAVANLSPAEIRTALRAKGFDAIVITDAAGAQQVLVLDAAIVKVVKQQAKTAFTAKAVPWTPADPAIAAAEKAALAAAERDRLASLPVDPVELDVPGLPAPPSAVTGRGKSSLGLDEAPDASHLLADREHRLLGHAEDALEKQKAFTALGGSRTSLGEAFARAGQRGAYKGNAEQKGLHSLVTELGRAVAKREGLSAAEFNAAEHVIVDMIKDWSGSADSRGAEVLKLLSERLRPGNLRTAKAGNGFFDHQERAYAAFVKSARAHLTQQLAGTGLSVEQFAAAYDAYVAAQRTVLRAAHPSGTIRVMRGVHRDTFFTNQGVSRQQFGSSVVVSHNSLSSFSARSGFAGIKFTADVPIDDIEYHYLLIRRSNYWNEAEVWLIGRPRRMELSGK